MKRLRPDLHVVPLRGNVETRLRKLDEGVADATLLALAGLKRLGLTDAATAILDVDEFLPAVGQGAIGIETRADDREHARSAGGDQPRRHRPARSHCERAFLAVLDGSCRTPIGGHATVTGGRLSFRGMIIRPDGSEAYEARRDGAVARRGKARRRCRRRIEGPRRARLLCTLRCGFSSPGPNPTTRAPPRRCATLGHEVVLAPLLRIEAVAERRSRRAAVVRRAHHQRQRRPRAGRPSPARRAAGAAGAGGGGQQRGRGAGGGLHRCELGRRRRLRSGAARGGALFRRASSAALSRRRGPQRRICRWRALTRSHRRGLSGPGGDVVARRTGAHRRRAAFLPPQRRGLSGLRRRCRRVRAHYCLSARAAEPLRAAGATRIAVAARPDEASLLSLVTPKS